MWLLTCEGDILDHKTIWLRPGSQHLLGRTTSADSRIQYIDHKSVSRKHLQIIVEPVEAGASAHTYSRSTITLIDASKAGTFVNGERLEKSKRTIDTTNTKIQLGTSNVIFHIRWSPVVLSFTNLSKVQKGKADPVAEYREDLERADIKLISTYLSDSTTHVVAKNRNNPACLQALAQAKWTVQHDWTTALIQAVRSETESPGGLEVDFHGTWPDEKQFIVPSGSEPVPQPDTMMYPDTRRSEVFRGLTFVFTNESQFQTLMPVIVAGGGKAHTQQVVAHQTTAREFVTGLRDYLRQAKTMKFPEEQDLRKVVIVRANPAAEDIEWWDTFNQSVEQQTRRKTILQSAFLNAILTVDTTEMCQSVSGDIDMDADIPSSSLPRPTQLPESAQQTRVQGHIQQTLPPPFTRALDKTKKLSTQPRFKGFDDFDPSQITHTTSPSPEPEPSMSNGHARKRPFDDDVQQSEAAAVKKPRLERQVAAKVVQPAPERDPFSRKTKDTLPDVKARLQEQKKKEAEEQALRKIDITKQMEGLEVEDLKKLVQHQEFEVTMPEPRHESQSDKQASARWDPAWNGRKNFKGFRPQGARRDESRQQRVMVSLQAAPVKRAAFLEDEYFLENQLDTRLVDNTMSGRSPDIGTQGRSTDSSLLHNTAASERSQTVAGTQAGKRPLEGESGGREAKRARRKAATKFDDDDDDELQFRRKRL